MVEVVHSLNEQLFRYVRAGDGHNLRAKDPNFLGLAISTVFGGICVVAKRLKELTCRTMLRIRKTGGLSSILKWSSTLRVLGTTVAINGECNWCEKGTVY